MVRGPCTISFNNPATDEQPHTPTLSVRNSRENARADPQCRFRRLTAPNGYDQPDDWFTFNDLTAPYGIFTCTRGTPGHSGEHFISLSTRVVPGLTTMQGIAVSSDPGSEWTASRMPNDLVRCKAGGSASSPPSIKDWSRWRSPSGTLLPNSVMISVAQPCSHRQTCPPGRPSICPSLTSARLSGHGHHKHDLQRTGVGGAGHGALGR